MMLTPSRLPRVALLLPSLLVLVPAGSGATAPVAAESSAMPISPEEVEGLLKLAAGLTERGDFDAAEIAFFQLLKAPQTPEREVKTALLGLARMYRKQGALTKAVAVYERYLKDNPNDERVPDALLDLGRTMRSLGLHKGAISRFYSVLNSTLKVSGGSFDHYQLLAKTAQFEIAQTHFEAGQFAEANKFFTRLRLLDLAPADRDRAHFMSAYALRLQGNLEAAAGSLQLFIKQAPQDENIPEARYLLAVTFRDLRRANEAMIATLELLRTAQSRTKSDPRRWAYWQRRTGNQLANDFYESGDTLNALAIYEGMIPLAPEPAWRMPLLYQVALCAERLGDLDRARQAHRQIIDAGTASDVADLVRLAKWRLEHLEWRDGMDRQIQVHFSTSTRPSTATPAADTATPPAASPNAALPNAAAPVAAAGAPATP